MFHREPIFCGPIKLFKILCVAQEDPFFLTAFQRKDAHFEHVSFHHFKQRRVAPLIENLGVDFLPSFAGYHSAFVKFAKDVHRKPGNGRVRREREIESSFGVPRVVVEKCLVDRRPRNAVFDVNVNVVFSQGEFGFLAVGVDRDQAVFFWR